MSNIALVHFCYMANDWEDRLTQQLNRIYNSGLYDELKEYYLVVTDVNNEKEKLDILLSKYPKIILEYYSNNKLYETYAIQKVHQLGLNNSNLNVLYIHVKGVFNNLKNFKTKETSQQKKESIESFIEMLEYTLIDNWKKCIDKLNEGHHIVGVNCVYGMWWGNFWWTKSEYLKTNREFVFDENKDSRWKCERWIHIENPIHSTPDFKPYEFYHFWCDNYYTKFPKYLYDGTNKSTIQFNIQKAEYGYIAEAQHEMDFLPIDENVTIDVTEFFKKTYTNNLDIYLYDKLPLITNIEPHWNLKLKIHYTTNIDPENIYFVSSIATTRLEEITKIQI